MRAGDFLERYGDGPFMHPNDIHSSNGPCIETVANCITLAMLGDTRPEVWEVVRGIQPGSLGRLTQESLAMDGHAKRYFDGEERTDPESNHRFGNPNFRYLARTAFLGLSETAYQLQKTGEVMDDFAENTLISFADFLRGFGLNLMFIRERKISSIALSTGKSLQESRVAYVDSVSENGESLYGNIEGVLNELDLALVLSSYSFGKEGRRSYVILPAPPLFESGQGPGVKSDFIVFDPAQDTVVGLQTKLMPRQDEIETYRDSSLGVVLVSGFEHLGNWRTFYIKDIGQQRTYRLAGTVTEICNRFYDGQSTAYQQNSKGNIDMQRFRTGMFGGPKKHAGAVKREREKIRDKFFANYVDPIWGNLILPELGRV